MLLASDFATEDANRSSAEFTQCSFEDFEAGFYGLAAYSSISRLRLVDSYIAAPDASRCKGLSRTRDGVVIAEADLNLCRQVKDLWCLQMTARHADYAKFLSDYVAPDYKPQVVKDPSLS